MIRQEDIAEEEIGKDGSGAGEDFCGRRVLAIQDLTGIGRCSGTVTLPVLSSAGITVNLLPTAVLSTQTDGFENYTFRDLTAEMLPIARHWQTLQLSFDAVYTSFFGATEQMETAVRIMDMLADAHTLRFIDPVLGDNGALYDCYDGRYVTGMRRLCALADIVTPNVTEAAILGGLPYRDGVCREDGIAALLSSVAALGVKRYVVLTGIRLPEDRIGTAVYDCPGKKISLYRTPIVPGSFPGAGDVFASAFLAGLLNGIGAETAVRTAVAYTADCIRLSHAAGTPPRFGLDFEALLWRFAEAIREKRPKPRENKENK